VPSPSFVAPAFPPHAAAACSGPRVVCLHQSAGSSSQGRRLIDDLLDISRMPLGKLTLRCEPVDAAAVVVEAMDAARPHIVAAEQHFTLKMSHIPVRLSGDGTRLAQVLSNLLINAAKYMPRAGRTALTVQPEADGAVIGEAGPLKAREHAH
jgi:signal transduction histidine kinase